MLYFHANSYPSKKSEKGLRWWLYQGGEIVAETVAPLQRGLDGHVGSQLPLLLS